MKKQKKTNYKETDLSKIKIEPPKGRPMLHWAGKKPLEYIKSFPEQLVEVYNPLDEKVIEKPTFDNLKENWQNLLFHGDNKEVVGFLLNNGFRGKIDLIYIDPPFDSGADYLRKIELRGLKERRTLEGEVYTLGEQLQYYDIWNNDGYLQYMYERILLLKELLSEKGTLYLHCDYRRSHYLRMMLDEIFSQDNFMNEITWKRKGGMVSEINRFGVVTDTILLYNKSSEYIFNHQYSKINTEDYVSERFIYTDEKGRKYRLSPLVAPAIRPNLQYEYKGYNSPRTGWAISKEKMIVWDKEGKLWFPEDKSKRISRKQYLDEWKGKLMQNIWEDIYAVNPQAHERTDYPTQKPESLLERIINTSTTEDSIVLDCFIGSGTTNAVAQKINRRWIGCDINKGAVQTTSKRLQDIISEQIQETDRGKEKLKLYEDENKRYFTFATYKVNDYDLKLLHTEAIELAIEHLGIKRVKTDNFFDGTRGKKLVKIIDFNHPLSLIDLQLIQDELKKRPDEDRNITIVCLGKELTTDDWIKDYNKKHPVNRIDVIELRTDSKYGKFLIHEPCKAKVDIKRNKNKA